MRKGLIKFKNQAKYLFSPITMLIGDFLQMLVAIGLVASVLIALVAIDAYVLTLIWDAVVPALFPTATKIGLIAKSVRFETMFWVCMGLFVLRPANLKHITKKTTKGDEDE